MTLRGSGVCGGGMGRRQHSVHNSCRWGIGLAGSLDWLGKEKKGEREEDNH